jgi:hypothetical protein
MKGFGGGSVCPEVGAQGRSGMVAIKAAAAGRSLIGSSLG